MVGARRMAAWAVGRPVQMGEDKTQGYREWKPHGAIRREARQPGRRARRAAPG